MSRKLRIEYGGACYHVINRGNYRTGIFESEGARRSFLECVTTSCVTQGWHLHAWCLMSNHYHLLVETPEANLVDGMKWLQSTFANRFNRFHQNRGHVFQGRYKAILLEETALGAVCHYIHLNPVRAKLITAASLQLYAASSFAQLWYPGRRWQFVDYASSLNAVGGLQDTRSGRASYRDYLEWLSADTVEQRRQGFEKMTRGWAKGSKDFKKAVLKEKSLSRPVRVVEAEAAEIREVRWEEGLESALAALGKIEEELRTGRKGEPWKVALARHLRERYLAPHRWIAERLEMGAPSSVQSLVSLHRHQKPQRDKAWKQLKKHV